MLDVLRLRQDPFAEAAFRIVVSSSKLGIIAALFVGVVEVAMHVELDAFLNGEFIGTDRPVDLGLLAAVEPVDLPRQCVPGRWKSAYVDECAVAASKPVPKIFLGRECPRHELDIA